MRARYLLSATLALAALGAVAAPAAEVAAPAPLSDAETVALLLVPDLRQVLDHVEAAAGTVAPGTVAPGQLAEQLGQMLQDPGLANLAPGAVIVAVAPDMLIPAIAAIVPAVDGELYVKAAELMGLGASATAGHVVLFQAGNIKADELSQRLDTAYAGLAAQSGKADLRLVLSPQRLNKAYGAMLQGFMMQGMRQAQAGGAAPGKMQMAMTQLYFQAMLGTLAELPVVQADLRVAADALGIDSVVGASGALAKALTPTTAPAKAGDRLGAGAGVMAFAGLIPPGLTTYVADQFALLQKKPGGKDLFSDDLIAQTRAWPKAFGSDVAMRLSSTEAAPYRLSAVGAVLDQAAAVKVMAAMQALSAAPTGLGAMNHELGLTTKIEPAARTVAGLSVTRTRVTVADDAPPATKQAAAVATAAGSMESAIGPAWYFAASEPAELDRLITAAPKPAPLAAQKLIGAGRDGYAEIDLVGMMQMSKRLLAAAGQPSPAMPEMDDAVAAPPISMAWTTGTGTARIEWRIPYAGFQAIGGAMGAGR